MVTLVGTWLWILIGAGAALRCSAVPPGVDATDFEATVEDTLDCQPDTDDDAEQCLHGLRWAPSRFQIRWKPRQGSTVYADITFPSPRPVGFAEVDQVHCRWYAVKDAEGHAVPAPAYLVVHESGSSMQVGRLIASSLPSYGVHGVLIELPGYGARRSPALDRDNLPAIFRQAIADVRRARDALRAIPEMRAVGLQGTSLGGFVATMAGALDNGFACHVLLLCGGDLYGILSQGQKDAAKVMEKLRATGATEEQLRSGLREIEPLRIAHRLSPQRTWLFGATWDEVVPIEHVRRLADRIALPSDHRIELPANHYSGIIYLPSVLSNMARWINEPRAVPSK
ncbi:MAG: hypothetical protein KatS3mg111_3867 [Pirellulaceae bacterium]|nr:MAG: hypothetical protein KatS3mg111_3867 [Pirellulaceae bacterium]